MKAFLKKVSKIIWYQKNHRLCIVALYTYTTLCKYDLKILKQNNWALQFAKYKKSYQSPSPFVVNTACGEHKIREYMNIFTFTYSIKNQMYKFSLRIVYYTSTVNVYARDGFFVPYLYVCKG